MGIFSGENRRGQKSVTFSHFKGIPSFEKEWAVQATLEEESIVVHSKVYKRPDFILPYHRIEELTLHNAYQLTVIAIAYIDEETDKANIVGLKIVGASKGWKEFIKELSAKSGKEIIHRDVPYPNGKLPKPIKL